MKLRQGLKWRKVRDATADAIEKEYGITTEALWSSRRYEDICFCRQVVYYTLYKKYGLTASLVGRMLGKNHGTILYGTQRIEGFMEVDPSLRKDIRRLVSRIQENIDSSDLL